MRDFANATWIQFVAQILAVAIAGLASGLLLLASESGPSWAFAILPWVALLIMGGLLLHTPRRLLSLAGWFHKIVPVDLHEPVTTHFGRLGYLAALHLAVLVLRFGQLWLILAVIAPDLPLAIMIFAFMVGEFAVIFPVTPGGVGFRELLLGVGALGPASEQLILAGLVDRAAAILVTLVLGAIALSGRHVRSDIKQ